MRVTLIHNPGAGNQGKNDIKTLEALLADAGHAVRYQDAKEEGWKKALHWPADLVAVAGGDGTVGRVTRRMVGKGVPVGLLPAGTANNIARTLGILERTFEDLVRSWEDARRVKLDVGVAKGPWGKRYFVEGVGVGLFAGVLANPAAKKTDVAGALRRMCERAESCEPMDLVALLDGEDISGRYVMLEAVNLRYVGPNLHLAPDSQSGDGTFEVVAVREEERERLLAYLDSWQDNRERLAVLPSRRAKRLEIEWTGFELHIDDKLFPKKNPKPKEIAGPVEACAGEAAVEFLVPASVRNGRG